MAAGEKPYRVYRGGRTKGEVPLQTRPSRPSAQPKPDPGAPRYPGPGPSKPEPRPSWKRRIGIAVLVLLFLFVVWAVASYFSFRGGVEAANKRLPAGAAAALTHQSSLLLSTPTDILLLGSDHGQIAGHEADQHSDSIMLIRTDPSRHRVSYLSIPRDLRVPVPGLGDSKVNAAMQSGGPALAIRTIQSYVGLPINHVIVVDFSQFEQVIAALGGITVNVPERIVSKFDCPYPTNARCARSAGWRVAQRKPHMD